MEKFGIYKLLSKLGEYYLKNNVLNNHENPARGDDGSIEKIFSFLKNVPNKPKETTAQNNAPAISEKKKVMTSPLITAMNSHDEFVKRVKSGEKNSNP